MRHLLFLVLAFIIGATVFYQIPHSRADSSVSEINIHMPMESERYRFNNRAWVAGIWHYVNITLNESSSPSKVTLILYKGNSIPAIKNETTYYSWEYDGTEWRDDREYGGISFIDPSKCKIAGNSYSFYIGTSSFVKNRNPDSIDYENWTLAIKVDNVELTSIPVVMEEATSSISVSRADYTLRCEPFTETTLKSSQKFLTTNTGNVPLRIFVSYNKLDSRINTSNFNTILHAGEKLEHSIEVETTKWQPGFVSISGTIEATALYVIPTGFISFDTSLTVANVPNIVIAVGHADYEIEEISNGRITFQYDKNIEMNYGERKNITAYICGDGDITVSITNTNTTILNVWSGEELIENIQHFVIHSTNSSEHPIIVQLQANKPNVTAYLIYTIQMGNESHIYTTTIKIGPEQKVEKKQDNSMLYIIVGMALAGVIGYVAYNQIKYRR
ncbi:MAG: hypothetical protein J7K13_06880 [Thermoplasmata archaeon]|nr:hypothetical protein [Thermoplasmata archaeon]